METPESKDMPYDMKKVTLKINRRHPRKGPSIDFNPIQNREMVHGLASPTVLTVERAAAVKVFLETYFNERLSRPSPRSLRRRYLEASLYHQGGNLTPSEKDTKRQTFYQHETRHLREERALITKSLGATQGRSDIVSDS
jgi:protein-serine/threonine kinase